MPALSSIVLALVAWVALCFFVHFLIAPRLAARCGGNPVTGLLAMLATLFLRAVHRPRYEGLEHVPDTLEPGPLIVVANHASGLDPLLLQIVCRFEIRWMMSAEMMVPQLDWVWRRHRMIPVDFDSGDSAAVREAIRHVKAGGVLGIFPEGGIERPPCVLRPFVAGAGLIIARTKAPVLLALITETPHAESAFGALVKPSRSRVRFLGRIDYSHTRDPRAISSDLLARLQAASGWPIHERPLADDATDDGAERVTMSA